MDDLRILLAVLAIAAGFLWGAIGTFVEPDSALSYVFAAVVMIAGLGGVTWAYVKVFYVRAGEEQDLR